MTMMRAAIRKAGNAGLVTTTAVAAGNTLHTMPTRAIAGPRTARVTKIMAWNNTGAALTLLIGTRDRAAVPAFVQLLPDLWCLNSIDNEWTEDIIPAVEWASDESLLAAGRSGDIVVVAGTVAVPVAGIIIAIEVEEYA